LRLSHISPKRVDNRILCQTVHQRWCVLEFACVAKRAGDVRTGGLG
jgi:hypothetical protein